MHEYNASILNTIYIIHILIGYTYLHFLYEIFNNLLIYEFQDFEF